MYHLCQLFGMIKADKGWSKRKEGDWASPLRIVYSYNSDCLTVAWWWKAWELSCQLPGGFTSSNVATSEVPLQVRRQRLLSNWGFLCKCSRCEAEDLWPRLRFIFGPKHTSKMGNFDLRGLLSHLWIVGIWISPLMSIDFPVSSTANMSHWTSWNSEPADRQTCEKCWGQPAGSRFGSAAELIFLRYGPRASMREPFVWYIYI